MTVRVAINGFGRIGRNVVRALYESGRRAEINVVAIKELEDAAGMAHFLKYDTRHGRFAWEVRQERDQLFVGDDAIRVLHERSLHSLPWRELGVDVVLDCTGVYGSREHGEAHIAAGAKKVLFSHPGSNDLDASMVKHTLPPGLKKCSFHILAVTISTRPLFMASIRINFVRNTASFLMLPVPRIA